MTGFLASSATDQGIRWALNSFRWALNRYWGVILLIVLWHAWVSIKGYNMIVMPHPSAVAHELIVNADKYIGPMWITFLQALIGLAGGMFFGIALAIVMWFSPVAGGLITPMALVLRSVPVVAMIPVLIRSIGFGTTTVVVVTIIITFFPAFVLCATGLRNLPPNSNDLFGVLGAGRLDRLCRLALPAAVPNILVALRLTAPISVLAAIVAQFLMGSNGLGLVIVRGTWNYEMNEAWGAAILSCTLSIVFFIFASSIEQKGRKHWT